MDENSLCGHGRGPVIFDLDFRHVGFPGKPGDKGDDGDPGKSAYQVAVESGFSGTEEQWLESLKGDPGEPGPSGGSYSPRLGEDGIWQEYDDALHMYVSTGVPAQGNPGDDGNDGHSPYIGENGRWFEFSDDDQQYLDTGLPSRGEPGNPGNPGDDGRSAYQVAVDAGFVGTQTQWLASLKGQTGDDGKSAYQVAVEAGYGGTEAQWLASLKGEQGDPGVGIEYKDTLDTYADLPATAAHGDAYLLKSDGLMYIYGDSGFPAEGDGALFQGPKGDDGDKGDKGDKGDPGDSGKSAYQVAVESGFSGTEAQWLASLKGNPGNTGDDGKSAYQVAVETGFSGTEEQWLESLKGEQGEQGEQGENARSPYIGTNGNWFEFNDAAQQYADSGKPSRGEKGDDGAPASLAFADLTGAPADNAALSAALAAKQDALTAGQLAAIAGAETAFSAGDGSVNIPAGKSAVSLGNSLVGLSTDATQVLLGGGAGGALPAVLPQGSTLGGTGEADTLLKKSDIEELAQDVLQLQGQVAGQAQVFSFSFAGAGITDPAAELTDYIASAFGATVAAGAAARNSDDGHRWTYYTSTGWSDDGLDTVSIATLATVGVVRASAGDGNVAVSATGEMSVNGWQALGSAVTSAAANAASAAQGLADFTGRTEGFATAAQGAKADTALQAIADGSVTDAKIGTRALADNESTSELAPAGTGMTLTAHLQRARDNLKHLSGVAGSTAETVQQMGVTLASVSSTVTALGEDKLDKADAENMAHTAPTAVAGTQDYYAYLHAPKPTNYELPIGTRHTFMFVPADIVEFASHVAETPEFGHPAVMRLASVSGDFHIEFRAERVALDPPVTVTVTVRYPSSDGTPQFMTIYNSSPDGTGDLSNPFAFDQEDYINLSNYDAALTVQGLDLNAATVRNLNLWHHAELEIWADARQDLKDVRDGVIGELLVAAGKIAAIEAQLPGFAHQMVEPAHNDTTWDFLHTDVGTGRTLSPGDTVWTAFTPEDVQEFRAHVVHLRKGSVRFGNDDSHFYLYIIVKNGADGDGEDGSWVEIKLEWQDASGFGQEVKIYDGPADGSGEFSNVSVTVPTLCMFTNNIYVFLIGGMDGGYEEIRDLELWKHLGSRSLETTLTDLEAVARKLSSSIGALDAAKLGRSEAEGLYQPRIEATGTGNLLTAPEEEGGQPGTYPLESLVMIDASAEEAEAVATANPGRLVAVWQG